VQFYSAFSLRGRYVDEAGAGAAHTQASHARPLVLLRLVALHVGEVLLPVVAPDSEEIISKDADTDGGAQGGDPAHACHVSILAWYRSTESKRLEEGEEAGRRVHPRHTESPRMPHAHTTPVLRHARTQRPAVSVRVEALDRAQARAPVTSAHRVQPATRTTHYKCT